jgi:hypothetical protein
MAVAQKLPNELHHGDDAAEEHKAEKKLFTPEPAPKHKKVFEKSSSLPAPKHKKPPHKKNAPKKSHFVMIAAAGFLIAVAIYCQRSHATAATAEPLATPMPDFSTPARSPLSASV